MIKILPLEEDNTKVEPYFRLVVVLGYGEHCWDTTTKSWLKIDDEKAKKYASLSEDELADMDWCELRELDSCITLKKAEDIVKFFNSLWKRKDTEGFEVDHIIINEGKSEFWWKECGAMTDQEFEWFSGIYDEHQCDLFNSQIENNWCGVVEAKIEYVDENGKIHKCEVI